MSGGDPYVYPGTSVLRNTLGLRDQARLDIFERLSFLQRWEEGTPRGRFDLSHLRAIHRHLFQDVYPWAGELRTVPLAKGTSHFIPPGRIETGMADIHGRLLAAKMLKGLSRPDFSRQAGRIIGDVNYVHPFREGNGRTQIAYLEQLARQAGHAMELERLVPHAWIEASIEAQEGRYDRMAHCIENALAPIVGG